MYTFTDRRIADALRDAAERGVHVRVYRDREQYEEELRKGSTVPSILAGSRNIEVRVKRSNDLMHEKSMLADSVLRSGSANWSVSAARYQDNEVSITTDPAMVAAFSREFREMWDRPDNGVVR
jgi:phosphatidylserine/phosphatidylglycerophosphate/cardiolipin synthase-like enzyme